MNIYSSLLNFFALAQPAYALNYSSHCETGEPNKHKFCTDTKIDIWDLLILLQRLLILLYKILKKIKILKFVQTLC
jgi:hypothetical protein